MAAVRTMFAAAREDAAIISTEIAASARTGALEAVRGSEAEVLNPLQIRQVAEASVKEAMSGESSILSQHLSHLPKPTVPQPLEQSLPTSLSSGLITKTLEKDLGVTFREAMSNAAETGVEEQMDEVVDVAKALSKGGIGDTAGLVGSHATL